MSSQQRGPIIYQMSGVEERAALRFRLPGTYRVVLESLTDPEDVMEFYLRSPSTLYVVTHTQQEFAEGEYGDERAEG